MNDQRATTIPVLLASAAAVGMLLAGCTSGTEEAAPQSPSPSAPPPPSASPTPTVPPELAGLEEGWEKGLPQPGSEGFVASSRNSVGGDSGTVSTWDDQVLKPGTYTLSFLCAADSDTPVSDGGSLPGFLTRSSTSAPKAETSADEAETPKRRAPRRKAEPTAVED